MPSKSGTKQRSGSKRSAPLKELKYQHNFTGVWLFDKAASQSMDPYFKAIGVPWIARRMVNGVKITSTIRHCNSRLLLNDASSLEATPAGLCWMGAGAGYAVRMGRKPGSEHGKAAAAVGEERRRSGNLKGVGRKGVWDKDGAGLARVYRREY